MSEQEEQVEQTHTTDVESPNEQAEPGEAGLTDEELDEERRGEGEGEEDESS